LYLHEDDESRKICYDLVLGEKEINVAVLPYLYTTKNQGISAQVEGWCRREGHTYVCADYHGVSQSAGRGDDGTLTRWIADTIEVLENAVPGSRTILVGAAVGAWVMLRVAMQRPDLVAGLVGISCDPDFTEELLWAQLSEEDKDAIMEKGKHEITWGDTQYVISKDLILDGRRNLVLQEGQNSLPIQVPVRLIHGTADEEVPLSTALRILDAVETDDAEVCILKGMSHFMQADGEFKALRSSLSAVVEASSNYGPFPLDCPGSG
jgi:pimeloyl-ACP methyl ester carboxylesterase